MKYIKVLLITSALCNICNMYGAEITSLPQVTEPSGPSTNEGEKPLIEETKKEETEEIEEKKNALQKWNEHLDLLKNQNEYWDVTNNMPTNDWKTTAFTLANNVLTQDVSMAEALKTAFADTIDAKKTKLTQEIINLITEFNTFIDNQASAKQETPKETKEVAPTPTTTVPETTAVTEPVSEPIPVSMETPATPQETTSTLSTSEIPATNEASPTTQQWQEQLDKVKKEGENWVQIDDILNKTYDIAKELLRSGQSKENTLQAQFYNALETRLVAGKSVYPLNIKDTMNAFNRTIGIFVPEEQVPYYQQYPSQQPQEDQLEKLRKELAEKDAKAKEELEKQHQKEEQERLKVIAAAQKAQEEGKLAKEQVHKLVLLQKELEQKVAKKHAEELEKMKKAHEVLAKNIEQIAASQKIAAEKGMLATLTEAVTQWWYGAGTQKPTELSLTEQDQFIDTMVQKTKNPPAAKETFKEFQDTLLHFNTSLFWSEDRKAPNNQWIQQMQAIITDMVIKYEIMPLKEVSTIVKKVLQTSGKISPLNLKETIAKIEAPTKVELAKQKKEEIAKQELAQHRQEQKEKIVLAQQKMKEEQKRALVEKERKKAIATTYADEKKQWYAFLDTVTRNRQATQQENHAHTQEALKKSQSLLQLAGNIPTKNKAALSQKLKQGFSLALLEQQKNGEHAINVHHNMDIFNNEINKMID